LGYTVLHFPSDIDGKRDHARERNDTPLTEHGPHVEFTVYDVENTRADHAESNGAFP
jgi:hypothetical protein